MSNLVAEELQAVLEKKGITLNESAFEEKVSEIVSSIDEAVNEGCITEDDKFYVATAECSIGGKSVSEGDYVEVEDTDEGKIATIYDADGEIKESDISVDDDEVEDFAGFAEELDDEDYEDLEEGAGCANCKEDDEVEEATKAEIMKARKMRAKGRTATGRKKLKGAALAKFLKSHKKMFKNRHKGNADKRAAKTRKKNARKGLYDSKASGTVAEAFNIKSDGMMFTAEAGDVIVVENGMASVTRGGSTVLSGLAVSEGFFSRCLEEKVIETEEDEKGHEEGVEEAAILTFKAQTGYTLVREGRELPLGNRIRARASLVSEGFSVTSDMLDSAARGEMVTL